jgi:hypothetical protein
LGHYGEQENIKLRGIDSLPTSPQPVPILTELCRLLLTAIGLWDFGKMAGETQGAKFDNQFLQIFRAWFIAICIMIFFDFRLRVTIYFKKSGKCVRIFFSVL